MDPRPWIPPFIGYQNYVNQKGWKWLSVILQEVMDDRYQIRDISVGAHEAAVQDIPVIESDCFHSECLSVLYHAAISSPPVRSS